MVLKNKLFQVVALYNVFIIIYKWIRAVAISIIQVNSGGKEKFVSSDLMGFDEYILRVALPTVIRKYEGEIEGWRKSNIRVKPESLRGYLISFSILSPDKS